MNEQNQDEEWNPDEGFSHFRVNLAVKYRKPQVFTDPTGRRLVAAGYFRTFVVVAKSEDEARSILLSQANDGEVDWQDSELERLSLNDLAEFSINPSDLRSKPSVVFRSSHFLYP